MKRLEQFIPVGGIFLLALMVRFIYNEAAVHDYYPLHDSLTYQAIAFNILREHCYCLQSHLPTVDRAPLWPALIAAIYGLHGSHDHYVRLFLCIVGSGTCALIYLFARDLFTHRVGLFAGIVASIYPFLFLYDGWLYSESVYIFLLLAFCYTLFLFQRTMHLRWAALSGILLGLLSLTRPNGLFILGLVILWAIVFGWKKLLSWRVLAQGVVMIALTSLVLVAPWTIRNYTVTHTLVLVATGDGKVLLGAYNDKVVDPSFQHSYYLGTWLIPNESRPDVVAQFPKDCPASCEVQRDATYKSEAGQWVQQHLSTMPYLLWLHFINTWQITSQEADLPINRFPGRPMSQGIVLLMKIMTPVIFLLAALGLLLTFRRYWRELLFIYFMILLTGGQNLVLYGIPRFRAPIEPMLIILAAGAVWWFVERVKYPTPERRGHVDGVTSARRSYART
jgi:4-amino-4-deoxy-L-arabinose transferase-like glycosyltransferase